MGHPLSSDLSSLDTVDSPYESPEALVFIFVIIFNGIDNNLMLFNDLLNQSNKLLILIAIIFIWYWWLYESIDATNDGNPDFQYRMLLQQQLKNNRFI